MYTMQKKQLIIFGGILLIVILFIVGKIIFFTDNEDTTNVDRNDEFTLPTSPQATTAFRNVLNDTLLNIKTNESEILMNDPRKIQTTTELGSGIYSLTPIEKTTPLSFDIVFNEENGSFAIGLTEEPIAQARREAEMYLQQQLNISSEQMCQLNIFVGVPYKVNTFYSGRNLGLSFCPNSVSLE